ncbi:hypothetical protein VTN00DRAFT_3831 [Thermoascus crustaceus]|uniref:uncharacterized protein n=1 Tax=Thermoascus crustaceus TaxID=5088 RepID=UPI003741EC6E
MIGQEGRWDVCGESDKIEGAKRRKRRKGRSGSQLAASARKAERHRTVSYGIGVLDGSRYQADFTCCLPSMRIRRESFGRRSRLFHCRRTARAAVTGRHGITQFRHRRPPVEAGSGEDEVRIRG